MAGVADQQAAQVRVGLGHRTGGDVAGGARPVLDDELPLQPRTQLGGQGAGHQVGAATRRGTDEDATCGLTRRQRAARQGPA